MDNIVNLSDRKKDPHKTGMAICLDCKFEWVAMAPVGVDRLECPSCGLERGVFKGASQPPDGTLVYPCHCGNDLFHVLDNSSIFCPNCGRTHQAIY